jgi:ethanolamine-phosphate cytidylyltransferase
MEDRHNKNHLIKNLYILKNFLEISKTEFIEKQVEQLVRLLPNPEADKAAQEFFEEFRSFTDKTLIENKIPLTVALKKYKRLYIDGCFDIVHSGHFNAIRQAKALCDTLVVGIISDEAILENKGYILTNYYCLNN